MSWREPIPPEAMTGTDTASLAARISPRSAPARVPWRIGVDACLNDRSEAKTYLGQLIGHFVGLYGADRIDLVRAGYRPDGGAHGESAPMQASFIGPVGVGAAA